MYISCVYHLEVITYKFNVHKTFKEKCFGINSYFDVYKLSNLNRVGVKRFV